MHQRIDIFPTQKGFPDFDPPKEILEPLAKVAYEAPHQYTITFGAENFRQGAKTEVGAIIIKSEIPLNLRKLFVLFLERTLIAIPCIVLFANLVL